MESLQVCEPAKGLATPLAWHRTLAAATNSSEHDGWSSATLRHWRETPPDMEQPALDQHYVALHLGGPKRVYRSGDGAAVSVDVGLGSLTIVPSGRAYKWRTEGPIEYAHLYLPCGYIDAVSTQAFGHDPSRLTLKATIGSSSIELETLFRLMLHEHKAPGCASRFLMDLLLQSFAVRLLHDYTDNAPLAAVRHAMSPNRLRQVLEHIEMHYPENLRLANLAQIAGTSAFHFSRAFRHETGQPPYRYLIGRRIAHAQALLRETKLPLSTIYLKCGFNTQRQFGMAFRQTIGISPSKYRHTC